MEGGFLGNHAGLERGAGHGDTGKYKGTTLPSLPSLVFHAFCTEPQLYNMAIIRYSTQCETSLSPPKRRR